MPKASRKSARRYEFLEVPGAFEIPAAIAMAAEQANGMASWRSAASSAARPAHYDLITNHVARGLMELSISGVPLGFGVLTVENEAQAQVRADRKQKNKGAEVVAAVLRMVGLSYRFTQDRRWR